MMIRYGKPQKGTWRRFSPEELIDVDAVAIDDISGKSMAILGDIMKEYDNAKHEETPAEAVEAGRYTPVAPTEAGMDVLSGVPHDIALPHIRISDAGFVNRLTRVNPETGQLESREVTREEAIELSNKIAIDRAERIKAFIIKKYGEWRIPSIQDWGDFKREQKEESRRAAQERENGQEGS